MVGEIEIKGLKEVERLLQNAGRDAMRVTAQGLAKCGEIAHRDAVRFAPRSPTKAEFSATLKRKKVTDRKNFFPGGLEKSIEWELVEHIENGAGFSRSYAMCRVFVRENSYAAKYARKIHDERGVSWHNLGPGSIAKGRNVGEEFVKRAILCNEPLFHKILEAELKRALGGKG